MKKLNPSEFQKHYAANKETKRLVDVRNANETALGILKDALQIPLPELASRKGELATNEWIYLYCRSGGRAQGAAEILESQGFTRCVVAVDGGFEHLQPLWTAEK